jgi:hypothetical protein
MSATHRLPYDDASTPQEMYDDCAAAGRNLHLPAGIADRPADPRFDPAALREPTPKVVIEVSEEAARLAGMLHLHLD